MRYTEDRRRLRPEIIQAALHTLACVTLASQRSCGCADRYHELAWRARWSFRLIVENGECVQRPSAVHEIFEPRPPYLRLLWPMLNSQLERLVSALQVTGRPEIDYHPSISAGNDEAFPISLA